MALLNSLGVGNEKWKSCKYEVHVDIRFSNGVVRSLKTPQITGLYLEKDFDSDHLPVMIIDLALSQQDEDMINDNTEFMIRINQYYTEGEDKEKKDPRIWINDTFTSLNFNTATPNNASTAIEKQVRQINEMTDDDVAPEDLGSQKSYSLGKKSDLILTKKIVNGNVANVTQPAILAYMLSKAGCNKDMLISNLTNPASIKEHIIHPNGLLYNMIYHEQEYGWHKEGTCIFFDYDTLYITRLNGVCTTWRKNEPKNICFCISEATSNDNVPSGVLVKNNMVYYNISFDQYNPSNAAAVSDQIEGNNMILVNTADGSSSSIQSDVSSYGNGAYATKTYHGHNPYIEEQYNRRKIEQENQIQLVCTNGDVGYLTPNKQISIVTDVTSIANNFRGNYRLASVGMTLIKNGEFFDSSTKIIVKRVAK